MPLVDQGTLERVLSAASDYLRGIAVDDLKISTGWTFNTQDPELMWFGYTLPPGTAAVILGRTSESHRKFLFLKHPSFGQLLQRDCSLGEDWTLWGGLPAVMEPTRLELRGSVLHRQGDVDTTVGMNQVRFSSYAVELSQGKSLKAALQVIRVSLKGIVHPATIDLRIGLHRVWEFKGQEIPQFGSLLARR